MPIYVFHCESEHETERIVSFNTQRIKCPICGEKAVRDEIELPARRNPAHGIQS